MRAEDETIGARRRYGGLGCLGPGGLLLRSRQQGCLIAHLDSLRRVHQHGDGRQGDDGKQCRFCDRLHRVGVTGKRERERIGTGRESPTYSSSALSTRILKNSTSVISPNPGWQAS